MSADWMRRLFWRLLDPAVRRIESRLGHYADMRATTVPGSAWSDAAEVGQGVVLHREASLQNPGRREQVRIGDFCHLRGELAVFGAGRIEIGHHSFLGPGSRIWSAERVRIGSHVLISHLVDIHDTNAHSLSWRDRQQETTALFEHGRVGDPTLPERRPVEIADHVWIGFKSSILKGVTIHEGAVVGAGSMVVEDVPPFTVVAGSPARIVRELQR